jgi:hypothetical protein
MKHILCSLYLLFAISAAVYSQNNKAEKIILDKVAALPEVRSFLKTAKASKPMVMIAGEPDKDFKYYWVKVGISNMDIFRTSYNFYVDPKTLKVFYKDTMVDEGDDMLTLQQWRQLRATKGFNQMHIYKNGKPVVLNN